MASDPQDEFIDKSALPDADETETEYAAPPIIGTLRHCKNCGRERIELIDKNGITDSGFKTWKWAQTCDNCKRNDCFEYRPIRLGDNVLETENETLAEYSPKNKESLPEIQKMESMEEWRTLVKSKYDDLKSVIESNLPQLWLAIDFILSIKCIMNIQNVTLPWFGILLGRPSSLKTAGIEALRDTPGTFYVDIFTPASFISNSTSVAKDKLKDIDMLPRIKNQLFLVSELSSMFTKKDEQLQETLGIFTRLADGHGLKTHTGAHGERVYRDIYFNLVGAAVDIPYKVYGLLGYLGPKLYFLRMPKMNKTEDDLLDEMYQDEYPLRFKRVQNALNDYLNVYASCPDMEFEKESKLSRIVWSKNDDRHTSRLIARTAMLLSHLRAVVKTLGETAGHGGTDYAYATAIKEEPGRAVTQLRNLARGHALSQGRTHITMEDLPLIIKVVLSTASIDRVNVFDLLIAHKGQLTTTIIEDSLNMSSPTARKTMTELKAIELVEMSEVDAKNHELQIKLKDGFRWFLGEDFAKLREGFIPTDNTEFMKNEDNRKSSLKEKTPPSHERPTQPGPPLVQRCTRCGKDIEAFYMKTHHCETGG
jgi:hypothetical protein